MAILTLLILLCSGMRDLAGKAMGLTLKRGGGFRLSEKIGRILSKLIVIDSLNISSFAPKDRNETGPRWFAACETGRSRLFLGA